MKTISRTISTQFRAGDSFEIIAVHKVNKIAIIDDNTVVSGIMKDVRGNIFHTFADSEITINHSQGLILLRVEDEVTKEWPECQSEMIIKFTTGDGRVYSSNRIRIYIERF